MSSTYNGERVRSVFIRLGDGYRERNVARTHIITGEYPLLSCRVVACEA